MTFFSKRIKGDYYIRIHNPEGTKRKQATQKLKGQIKEHNHKTHPYS